MYVAALRIELRIRDSRSLKEKRHIVKSLVSHLQRTFGVAVAEVDHQSLWQRSTLGVAVVSAQAGHLDRILHTVERAVRARNDVEVIDASTFYLEETE